MRCWSLNTCPSKRFQGRAFHSYTGVAAVLMTSALLLAPLPSSCRGRRQRIPGVTPGLGFFAHPPTPALAAGTCSALDRRGERRGGYFVPVVRFALAVGSYYPPGLVRVNAGQGWSCRPRILPLLGQA